MTATRIVAGLAIVAALAWLGWCVVNTTRVDVAARADAEAALQLDPAYPRALLQLSRRQLGNGEIRQGAATAKRVLAIAPGQGDAFGMMALAAAGARAPNALELLEIAAIRAPRISQVRAQLAVAKLRKSDLAGALAQIDALLRFDPAQSELFFPAMAAQSADPGFADAMAVTLARDPPWRESFLAALSGAATAPGAVSNIYSRLLARGGLSTDETRRWLDGLMAQGRWGDAFAAWVGTLQPPPARLPSVRNGGFEQRIDGIGFGWRNDESPGVFTDVEAGAGFGGGSAARMHFIGRPAAKGNLRQALMLAPGRYALSLRARAEGLRSDQGLAWVVRCDGGPQLVASEALDGSFDWKEVAAAFEVPPSGCDGQWLELLNPAVSGSAQQVQGDLWVDDVAITPSGAE